MPDDDEEVELTPQDSKCFTCKHGMALHDKDVQTFVQPGMVPGNKFTDEDDQPGVTQMSIDMTKVRSVCFWRAHMAPIIFNVVTECSRYEA